MFRYKLRTLMIVLAVAPMVLALLLTGLVIPLVEQYLDKRPVRHGSAFAPGPGDILVTGSGEEQYLEYGPLVRP